MPESTLDKLEHGTIRVGSQRHTPPFSYASGDSFAPNGYSVALFEQILERIRGRLGLGHVEVIPVEVTSATRLDLLERGFIDIECGSTTITAERQKGALFSRPIFHTSHRILTKDAMDASQLASSGMIVVTGIESSTSHAALLAEPSLPFRFEFSGCPDIFSAFERFRNDHRTHAMVADEVILRSLLARSGAAGQQLLPNCLGGEYYGFLMRKDDAAFRTLVDEELDAFFDGPSFAPLYEAWFIRELPDLGFGLDLSMSEALLNMVRTRAASAR